MTARSLSASTLTTSMLAIAAASAPAMAQPAPVDLVFVHGTVLIPGGSTQAIAVAGDTIVAVGSDAEIEGMAPPTARKVDLAGHTVMPGLYDMHVAAILQADQTDARKQQGKRNRSGRDDRQQRSKWYLAGQQAWRFRAHC